VAGVVVLILIVAAVVFFVVQAASFGNDTSTTLDPGYPTALPSGKTAEKLGGWQRVSPPSSAPVYAFADTVSGVSVSVSEQPLPDSFITDTDSKVAELAKQYNATDKLNASGTTVYIGTSSKGPQSVIFAKKNLLILIKSEKKIDDSIWLAYISSFI